jgi:hypothetical protein
VLTIGELTNELDNNRRIKLKVSIREVQRLGNLSACWIMDSHKDNAAYYPRIVYKGIRYRVHRLVKMIEGVTIPVGMTASHLCETMCDTLNYQCVNPDHIVIETQKENLLRSPKYQASWKEYTDRVWHKN